MSNLRDFVFVAPRYARSINLERDGFTDSAVEGYVITATAEQFLMRFGRTLAGDAGFGAWTLTGPYGAGKSSFAIFMANLFSPLEVGGARAARKLLREQHPHAHSTLFDGRSRTGLGKDGFTAVVVSGASEALLAAIVRCVVRDAASYYAGQGRKRDAFKDCESLNQRLSGGENVSTSSVLAAITRLSEDLIFTGRSRGVLIIIDELGKFLEYASRTQTSGEIFVLQQLAEATNRSTSVSLYLVTILHQSFERYASELRPRDREEWAKVQGRFEDVAFQEPPEQLLELIGQAIVKHPNSSVLRPLHQRARELADEAVELALVPRGMSVRAFRTCLERSSPLHPLTTLVLIRLCRKFGQNQRSLFSFLTSREGHGLSSFLDRDTQPVSFYRLPELYDYLVEGFGSGLAVGEAAGKWNEIRAVLDRAGSLDETEIRFLKAVGVLAAAGSVEEAKASPAVVQYALGLDSTEFKRCKLKLRERSLIVERKHSGTIALWEGSDLDLDEEVRNASTFIASNASLADKLNQLWAPRPLVAKGHSFRTGTLRYVNIRFADSSSLGKSSSVEPGSDGLLLYCLPSTTSEREMLIELATKSILQDTPAILVAIPQHVSALEDAVRELEALRYVQLNKRELESDSVARRELRTRISVAENRVSVEVQRLFSPEEPTADQTQWFHHGMRQPIPSSRTLATYLSAMCDKVYPDTPILKNELVNRRSLSSAAAAARRNLLGAMLSKGKEALLGFEGTPPEVSIYRSLLGSTGIHRLEEGTYTFGAPSEDDALLKVWNEIVMFFGECEMKRQPVAEMFARLQRPPYGLKLGVIPVLFGAAAIAHDTEIAFYEGGAFLPELTAEAFERLVRSPASFEVRRYQIEGVRKDVYLELGRLFGKTLLDRDESLLSVVKPLFRFLRKLPAFCQSTTRLTAQTIAVRKALLHAKEPDHLLFVELPQACGMEPFGANEESGDRAAIFFAALRSSITELQRAFDDLMVDVRESILRAFNTNERKGVCERAQAVVGFCVDSQLKAVVKHMTNDQMDDALWSESIATTLAGKAPRSWVDEDRVRFEVALAQSSRNIRHLEALLHEEQKRRNTGQRTEELFRIGVANRHSMEVGAVVAVEKEEQDEFAAGIISLQERVTELGLSNRLTLAIMAFVSQGLLSEFVGKDTSRREVIYD